MSSKGISILGIDDFAFRKNLNYGTIFVNQKDKRIIDIIDSREQEKIISYLKQFDELEIVTRDGSPLYRNAIKEVNTEIKQISDKFHLIKNLIDNIKLDLKIVMKQNIVLKEEIYDISDYHIEQPLSELKKQKRVIAKQNLVEEIRKDRKEGYSLESIAKKHNVNFRTVRKYLDIDAYQYRVHHEVELDKYSTKIYECMKQNLNAHQIYMEITKDGYKGSYPNFFKQFKLRVITKSLGNTFQISRYKFQKLLYNNEIEKLKLDKQNEELLRIYLKEDNEASRVLTIMNEFREVFEKKDIQLFDIWIKKYKDLANYENLKTFIRGLQRDKEAIKNQIINIMTNGLIEGKVNKLKVIKRRTYGRCSFHLLRCLILLIDAPSFE